MLVSLVIKYKGTSCTACRTLCDPRLKGPPPPQRSLPEQKSVSRHALCTCELLEWRRDQKMQCCLHIYAKNDRIPEHTVDNISWSLWLSWLWKAVSWHIKHISYLIVWLLPAWDLSSWLSLNHATPVHCTVTWLWRGEITPDQLDTYLGLEQLQADIWQILHVT